MCSILRPYVVCRAYQGESHSGHCRQYFSSDLYKLTGGTFWAVLDVQGSHFHLGIGHSPRILPPSNTCGRNCQHKNRHPQQNGTIRTQMVSGGELCPPNFSTVVFFGEWTFLPPTPTQNPQHSVPGRVPIISLYGDAFLIECPLPIG